MWADLLPLAASYNINLAASAPSLFQEYYHFLMAENKKYNLTSITEPREVLIKHFLDSLMLLARVPLQKQRVLDMGSGAGLPGIPLKIALPQLSLTLVDSLQKRVAFLELLAQQLQLKKVNCFHGRAEDLAQNLSMRQNYDVVMARAVARLSVLTELCLPFVRVGGLFAAYKGPEGENELQEAAHAITELGGKTDTIWHYELPQQMGTRTLILIKKIKDTPAIYPRRAGLPAKKPLVKLNK